MYAHREMCVWAQRGVCRGTVRCMHGHTVRRVYEHSEVYVWAHRGVCMGTVRCVWAQ